MATKKSNRNISIYFFLIVPFLIIAALINWNFRQTSNQNSKLTKTFESSNIMNFTIEVPKVYTVEERMGSVTIQTPHGVISIGMNGTNYDNINDYFNNSPNKFNERTTEKNNLTINNLSSIKATFNDHRTYFVYTNFNVYLLSTKNPSLYSDLDEIAQSFRYIPK